MSGFYYAMAAMAVIAVSYTIGRPARVPARVIEPWERVLSVFLMGGGLALDIYAAVHL